MADRGRTALWSPEALSDIEQIWNYYDRAGGRSTAEKIVRIATIENHPLAGRQRWECPGDLRSFAVKPHVIFYRVIENTPEIVRILDGRQDVDEIL
jgi:toxin ParE1/3/4